jgi:hypothetical protein
MKHQLIAALNHKVKPLAKLLQGFCVPKIVQTYSFPAFPDIGRELHGDTDYRNRIRRLARFFFILGCLTLISATSFYLWQLN